MTRLIQLPDRRVSRCEKVRAAGSTYFLHCGFAADGSVREIFVSSKYCTSDIIHLLTDVCIGISHRLQHGERLADIAVRGAVMQVLVERARAIEREEAAAVIADYARAGVLA